MHFRSGIFILFSSYFGHVFGKDQQCFVAGECINSPFISSSLQNSENNCLRECQDEVPGCAWFSFDPSIKLCMALANCTDLSSETCPRCVSGEVTCQAAQCNLSGVCQGTLLGHSTTALLSQCQSICEYQYSQCNWFSFNQENGICLIFSSCPSIDEGQDDFISGQRVCDIPHSTLTKVLVATGYSDHGLALKTQVLDLTNDNSTCNSLPSFDSSNGKYRAVGGLLGNNKAVICGGFYPSNQCYQVTQSSLLSFAQMSVARVDAAMVQFGNSLWILGGFDESHNVLSSTEFIHENGQIESGPDMPLALFGHSVIALNQSTYLLTGGETRNKTLSNATFLFNIADSKWSRDRDLNFARRDHGIAHFREESGDEFVVVSGGLGGNSSTIEIYHQYGWRMGPNLPQPLIGHVSLSFDSDLVVLGGNNGTHFQDTLYRMTCPDEWSCQWTTMSQKLETARDTFVAFGIPDILAQCT